MKNPNKYFKTLKFTVAEIDTIDERLNATSKMIEESGGLVVGVTAPVTFGVKPIRLIYTLIYTSKADLSDVIGGGDNEDAEKESDTNGDDSQ